MASLESVPKLPGTWMFDGDAYSSVCHEQDLTYIRDELQLLSDDIVVATYPKSGTTWMQEIIWTLLHGSGAANRREQALDENFSFLEGHRGESGLEKLRRLPKPRLIKTHLKAKFFKRSLEGETGCPRIIVTIRNPKDAYVSYQKFISSLGVYKEFDFNFFYEMIRAHTVHFGDAFHHMLGWWMYRDHPNVHIVKFEDMKIDPRRIIQNLADFLEMPVGEDTLDTIVEETSFAKMRARPLEKYFTHHGKGVDFSKFFRKGEVGGSNDILTEDQIRYLDERIASELKPVGIAWD